MGAEDAPRARIFLRFLPDLLSTFPIFAPRRGSCGVAVVGLEGGRGESGGEDERRIFLLVERLVERRWANRILVVFDLLVDNK